MNTRKKILIFSTAYYPFVGGAEIAIKELADRMPEADFEMITAKMKRGLPKEEKLGNVLVRRIGLGFVFLDKLLLPFWGAWTVVRLRRKNHYDFFWCVMISFATLSAYLANIFSFGIKTPTVLTLQEGDSEEHLKKRWFGLINAFWFLVLKRTEKATAISSYLEKRARRFGYKGEIRLIPNGVDFSVFKNDFGAEKLREKKARLGFLESDKIVFTASRLTAKNGMRYLVSAMAQLPAEFKLVVAGIGEEMEELEALGRELSLGERVKFIGFVSHVDLPEWLALSFVFVRPSLSEGFGNAFIEAMAMKVPIIGTDAGGIPDFLIDGETGLVCQKRDAESIAKAVLSLWKNEELRRRVAERAFQVAEERYDWNNLSLHMKDVFEIK